MVLCSVLMESYYNVSCCMPALQKLLFKTLNLTQNMHPCMPEDGAVVVVKLRDSAVTKMSMRTSYFLFQKRIIGSMKRIISRKSGNKRRDLIKTSSRESLLYVHTH